MIPRLFRQAWIAASPPAVMGLSMLSWAKPPVGWIVAEFVLAAVFVLLSVGARVWPR